MEQNGTSHTPEFLKRRARALRKETGIPHSAALDQIVQAEGFANWPHYLKALRTCTPVNHNAGQQESAVTWLFAALAQRH